MKAISIKQPWASLIAHGIKDIENRTWACPEKYIGKRVLIHASAKGANFWDSPIEIAARANKFISVISKSGTDWSKYPFGSIIGSIEIVDCVINHSSIWAEETPNYVNGLTPKVYEDVMKRKIVYNWVLANPILFKEPIPAKGKLSFWDFDGELPFDKILEANKNVLKRTKEKVESGKITIREAAIIIHKAGWTNYIDIDKTKRLLNV